MNKFGVNFILLNQNSEKYETPTISAGEEYFKLFRVTDYLLRGNLR